MGALKVPQNFSLVWPDKTALSADTAGGLLDRIAALQWDQPCDRRQVRARLVDRAKAWSGADINEECTDVTFLRQLSAAGMFVLLESYNPNPYKLKEH